VSRLPIGTVTLLFTDIEGSTELLRKLGRESYVSALAEHRRILRESAARHRGVEVEMQGDSFFFAFAYARDAAAAAADAQRELAALPAEARVLVRMGLHTGEPVVTGEDLYAGLDVHRAARVMAAASGGQVLLTARTTDLIEDELGPGLSVRPLGQFKLPDFDRPEALTELVLADLPKALRAPRAEAVRPARSPLRARALLVLGTCAVLAGGGVAALFALAGAGSGPTTNVLVSIDPGRNAVDHRVAVGSTPTSVAVGYGGVWVLNAADSTITEADPSGRVVRTLGTSGVPVDVTTAGGSVWIADRPNVVLRVDPTTGNTLKTIVLKAPPTRFGPFSWFAVGRGSVWVSVQKKLARIDPQTNLVRLTDLPPADWGPIAVAPDGVWESETQTLYHLDAAGRHVVGSLSFPQGRLLALSGSIWAINEELDVVAQIDPRTNTVTRTVPVGAGPFGIAYGAGRIWVSSEDGTVTSIDPEAARAIATVRVGGTPQGIAVGYGRVWVAVS
jgi:YVTN family beta-propeller protein